MDTAEEVGSDLASKTASLKMSRQGRTVTQEVRGAPCGPDAGLQGGFAAEFAKIPSVDPALIRLKASPRGATGRRAPGAGSCGKHRWPHWSRHRNIKGPRISKPRRGDG